MPLSVGDKLGPYEILSPIGAGGMGEVWRARDTRLDRVVAIKKLNGQHSARFQQEARAIAALNHPHICQIYDVGPDYLVLEYVEGAPVKGPMALADAVRAALQIASALEAAHTKKILHRDLKPSNILMSSTGTKLLDFGLAKLLADEDATETHGISGTPLYMSPEQAEGKPLDARSDVFSFGSVLYELLTGRRAFDSLAALLRDDPQPLGAVPASLRAIVTRCLRKNPVDRFGSIAELRAALEDSAAKPASLKPSIAVLPFVNMSGDKEQEYFSDGLAEEIINALVKVPGFKVIARTSAFAFKGQNTDVRKIAETLGVTDVLEGSVRRSGNRIRVTAQLITAADGSHLWSERYDRQMEDLFAMQDEIAAAITAELKLKFTPDAAAPQRRQPNLQAYEAYLRYRQYQWGFSPEALQRSKECLDEAIALDPEFALPYVGLADHHFSHAHFEPASECFRKARQFAEQALRLDPNLAEAQAILGVLCGLFEHNWREAEHWFRLALTRQDVPWHVRAWHAWFYLMPLGRYEEARRQTELALADNPLSQILYCCLGLVLEGSGLAQEAGAAFEEMLRLDTQFWMGRFYAGMHRALHGHLEEARRFADQAMAAAPFSHYSRGLMAGVLRLEGKEAEVRTLLSDHPAVPEGCAHLIARNEEDAVRAFENALQEDYGLVAGMFAGPFRPWLQNASRWPELMRKLGLAKQS